MLIGQAEWLHRPVPQSLAPALRHHLDWQATVEIGRGRFEIVERGFVGGKQRIDEALVIRLRQRTIDVVSAGSRRTALVIAGLKPSDLHIDGIAIDDRRDSVEK